MTFLPFFVATVTLAALTTTPTPPAGAGAPVTDVRSTRIQLSTGVALQVVERGPPDGEPVLFLHGFTDSWFSFTRVLDRLPPPVRAIVPDAARTRRLRPAGLLLPRGRFCCRRRRAARRAGIAARDGRRALDGQLRRAAHRDRHPGRVSRLVLVGSGTTVRTPRGAGLQRGGQQADRSGQPAFIRDFQESTIARPCPPTSWTRSSVKAKSSRRGSGAMCSPG